MAVLGNRSLGSHSVIAVWGRTLEFAQGDGRQTHDKTPGSHLAAMQR